MSLPPICSASDSKSRNSAWVGCRLIFASGLRARKLTVGDIPGFNSGIEPACAAGDAPGFLAIVSPCCCCCKAKLCL